MLIGLLRRVRRFVELVRWIDRRQRAEQEEIEHLARMRVDRKYRDAELDKRIFSSEIESDGLKPSRKSS
ncbi:MAG: hypothetical protein IV100_17685 [Myxococcales bacterium]|nr:hypothetical protein [Myxococcales bacterium]